MKSNDSFAEKTVRVGCIASGVGAGCGLALFATCASVGVAKAAEQPFGLVSIIVSLLVAAVLVVLVFLLVRKNMEVRLLREEMAQRQKSTSPEDGQGHNP